MEDASISKRLISLSQRNDFLYLSLKRLNRFRVFLFGIVRKIVIRFFLKANYDAERLLLVDPKSIEFKSTVKSNKFSDSGKILAGEWDLDIVPFSKYLSLVDGLSELLLQGREWKEIKYFQDLALSIEQGNIHAGCRTIDDLEKRVADLKKLFHDIKEKGYTKQSELVNHSDAPFKGMLADEISVNIGRDGEILFDDGAHRLAIAKILKLPPIPVRVVFRHAKWVAFRQEILDFAKTQEGKIYQKTSHPDLQDIEAFHNDDRMKIITPHLPSTRGTVLDIGANWGYFCGRLEELGFDCYAVEADRLHYYFMERLRRAEKKRFKSFNMSIFDFDELNHVNVMLAFNIFHHFLFTEETYHQLEEFLRRVTADVVIFQPHKPEEFEKDNLFRNYPPEEFVKFVLETAGLSKSTHIGTAQDGRPIYKLER